MYLCWNCGLWFGEPDTPIEPSHLCPACRRAMGRKGKDEH